VTDAAVGVATPPYRLDGSQPMSFKYRLSPIDGDFTPRTKEAF